MINAAGLAGSDTIAAIATAPGRSALAIVRMSGPRAFAILRNVAGREPQPRVATLLDVSAANGDAIDRCLVTTFPAPHSYTGADVVEFSVHGGHIVPALVLEALIRAGAREALPGEFTRIAVLNGKLDLVQAEAVGDLIDARSRGSASAARRLLDGGLTRRISEIRSAILDLEALIAYDIDFPEEDDGPVSPERIRLACNAVAAQLASLLATAGVGELLREGALVVIAGAPNAGKSSLFNALLGRKRALVTEIAGTTRDAIEAVMDAGAWTLRLVDTAGLRDASDLVERLGIEVAEDYLGRANVVLACGDSNASAATAVRRIHELTSAPVIPVRTKSDIGSRPADASDAGDALPVSAVSGDGLRELIDRISATLAATFGDAVLDAPLLLRARHERAVAEASNEIDLFARALADDELPIPVAATHLRSAVLALESLIGGVDVDEILDRVFRNFCVGK